MEKISTRISNNSIASEIAKKESGKVASYKKNIYHKRLFIKCSPDEFLEIVKLKGERIFREMGDDIPFDIDIYNKDIIQDLYYYATGNPKFSGNLRKGLWFWSTEYGTGKSTILQIMQELFNDFNRKVFPLFECKTLGDNYIKLGILYFKKRTIYLDDIGREQKLIKYYGNEIQTIPSIMHMRDKSGAWTHGSSQKPILKFNSIYGKVTTDRMTKAFNEIEFKGKTRRK